MTAVTNSAVDSASTRRISQVAGTTVRYGRIAKPTTIQATTHGREERAGVVGRRNRPRPAVGQGEADEPPEGGAQDTDIADQRLPRRLSRRPSPASDGPNGPSA